MTRQYRLTQPALHDIQDITEYLAEQAGFTQAEAFIQKLNIQFNRIIQFPNIGKPRNDLLPGCRMLALDRYLIFYLPNSQIIEILRIVGGYRDLSQIFPSDS